MATWLRGYGVRGGPHRVKAFKKRSRVFCCLLKSLTSSITKANRPANKSQTRKLSSSHDGPWLYGENAAIVMNQFSWNQPSYVRSTTASYLCLRLGSRRPTPMTVKSSGYNG